MFGARLYGASWFTRAARWIWAQYTAWRDTRRLSALLKSHKARGRRTQPSEQAAAPRAEAAPASPPDDTPEVKGFNEKAANYLFEQYGVFAIPAPYWALLDDAKRPVDAFARFLRQLGLSVEEVRNRSEQALARLRDYCEYLFVFGDDIAFLDRATRSELARRLSSDDADAVRDAFTRIERARLILDLLADASERRAPGLNRIEEEARKAALRPLETTAERLGELHAETLAWREALASASGALEDAWAADRALAALLRDGARLEGAEDEERRAHARVLDSVGRRLKSDPSMSAADVRSLADALGRAATVFDQIRAAAAARQAEAEHAAEEQARKRSEEDQARKRREQNRRRTREKAERDREEERRRQREQAERAAKRWRRNYADLNEALEFFGFSAEGRPSWREIHRRFVKMRAAAEAEFTASKDKTASDRMRDMQSYYLQALRPNRSRFA